MCYSFRVLSSTINTKEEIMLDKKTQKTQKSAALTRWHSNKITLAHRWIDDEITQKQRRMVQGAIHLCELGENVGSEQNKKRPVLIISNNNINKNNTNVVVIPLSSKLATKTNKKGTVIPRYSTHYFLKKSKYTFLDSDSSVKTEHIATVSKVRLDAFLGKIDQDDIDKVSIRLKTLFDI